MHLTVARAYPILLALLPDSDQQLVPAMTDFSVDPAVLYAAKEWSTAEVQLLMTESVRQVVLNQSKNERLVELTLDSLTIDDALQLLCTENIPASNLR